MSRLSSRTRDLVRRVRDLGLAAFVVYALKRIFQALVYRKDVLRIFVREAAQIAPSAVQPNQSLRLEWFDLRTLRRYQSQHPRHLTDERLRRYEGWMAGGDRCYGLVDGESLVTMGWVRRTSVVEAAPEVGSRFSLPLGEPVAVIYDCWTFPEHRGRGAYAIGLDRVATVLLERIPRVLIYCLQSNTASERGIRRAGFELYATHVRRRLLGVERHATTMA
jgi:RimJ/RimL family protein N-acetyltransferase